MASNLVLRTVYLSPAVDDRLRDEAYSSRRSKNDLIRQYIEAGMRAMSAHGAVAKAAAKKSASHAPAKKAAAKKTAHSFGAQYSGAAKKAAAKKSPAKKAAAKKTARFAP